MVRLWRLIFASHNNSAWRDYRDMNDQLTARLEAAVEEHLLLFQALKRHLLGEVIGVARILKEALDRGKKILVAGNGGSAADAQHFAAELVGRFMRERRALAAIALTTDTSILTAVGNDYGFDQVFSRQVEGLGRPGDVLIGISTSGRSLNLIRALKSAAENRMVTVALLGKSGGEMKHLADHVLVVPSEETPRIQEAQQWIWHTWCDLIDQIQ